MTKYRIEQKHSLLYNYLLFYYYLFNFWGVKMSVLCVGSTESTLLEGPVRQQVLDDVIMQHPDPTSLRCQAVFQKL